MRLRCVNCSYEEHFETGASKEWGEFPTMLTYGMAQYEIGLPFMFVPRFQEPAVSRQRLDDENRARLIHAFHANIDTISDRWVPHQYELYQCPTCDGLTSRFWCAIWTDEGALQPDHHCRKDGSLLVQRSIGDLSQIICPSCHERTLRAFN